MACERGKRCEKEVKRGGKGLEDTVSLGGCVKANDFTGRPQTATGLGGTHIDESPHRARRTLRYSKNRRKKIQELSDRLKCTGLNRIMHDMRA